MNAVPEYGSLGAAAANYAGRGWPVFPCLPQRKEPMVRHGLLAAATDPQEVAAWWGKWAQANIGINLGEARLVALDVDDPSLAGAVLAACPHLPQETWCQRTPRGGLHVVVSFEEGEPPRTRHLYDAQGRRLGELRSDGGYILVWPSRTESGAYELLSPRLPWEDGAVKGFFTAEDAEAFLLGLLREAGVELRQAAPRGPAFPTGHPLHEGDGRNNALYLTGRRLLREGVPAQVVEATLRELNYNRAIIAQPLDERELTTLIRHVLGQSLPGNGHTSSGAPPAEALERELDEAFTDRNLARTFAEVARNQVLFVPQWGWLYWDGRRWARDEGGHRVMAVAMDILPRHFLGRAIAAQGEARARLLEMARKAMSRQRLSAALELAKGLLLAEPNEFDRDPFLLNCLNGTIDLRTGELKPHNPADRITKLAPGEYDPDAEAPTWQRFLEDVFCGDKGLLEFVQRAVGYSATGDVREDCFFLCYGTGSNGKTTFLNTIRQVLGDYGQAVAPDLLVSRRERGDTHPAVLADLYGARFCMTTETQEDKRLDEARVKMLTGRDPIKARYLHRGYFEFQPTHKIWLATNHLPVVSDTTEGLWRRIRVLPFLAYFGPDRQDRELPQKLLAEAAGILTWVIQGARRWLQEGLGEAQAVSEATSRYRTEMDILADWLQDCCEQDSRAVTPLGDLYASYKAWCERNRETPLSQRSFGRRLSEKGYELVRLPGGTRARRGLRLKPLPDGDDGGRDDAASCDVCDVSDVSSEKTPLRFTAQEEFSGSNALTSQNVTGDSPLGLPSGPLEEMMARLFEPELEDTAPGPPGEGGGGDEG
jgi:putative DNA primase/helicase